MMFKRERNKAGFTLIELLVVIAIIAILAAILFPVFIEAKAKGRDTKCMSNLRQIGMGFRGYIDDWNSRFMPAAGYSYPGCNWHMWSFVAVLKPYVKNSEVFLCPSAPKRLFMSDPSSTNDNPNADDCGWTWSIGPQPQKSHYGNNIYTGGYDPINGGWGPKVPTEDMIRYQTRVIYLIDARWVDLLQPGVPGRIGKAKFRHHGGSNTVCCDGHAKWLEVNAVKREEYWNYLR